MVARLALPGSDIVLPAPDCAATLAHLVACAFDPSEPANGVRAAPLLDGGRAFVAVSVGLQDLRVSADTAELAVADLDADTADTARADAAQRAAVGGLRRAVADARNLAALAERLARRP